MIMNYFSAREKKVPGVTYTKPSETIPSQSLPLRTLIERYTRGQEVRTFTPTYDAAGEFPALERMDALEKAELARSLKNTIQDYRSGKNAVYGTAKQSEEKPVNPEPKAQD